MIARGDLAVEIGWQRLAEVQKSFGCARRRSLPVVWATQVLEKLTKEGTPTRAEITDAAMGVRAECVMLNKGPSIVDAVRVLSNICRMQDHQVQKRPLLRRLRLADNLTRVDDRLAPSCGRPTRFLRSGTCSHAFFLGKHGGILGFAASTRFGDHSSPGRRRPAARPNSPEVLRAGLPADVLYAQDGEEALRRVRDYHPDLVISDLHMPRLGGLELVEILRSEFPASARRSP